jgi:hypothetical protein
VALLAAGAVSLSACTSLNEVRGTNRYGSITISASSGFDGPFVATPTAAFFTGVPTELPTSRVTSDQCGTFAFTQESFAPGNLDAGAALQLLVGNEAYQMSESASVPGIYTLTDGDTFLYSAGDTIRVSVPGAAGGFPASQVALRLAEPIRLGPVVITENQDLPVTWASNGDANSGVIISVRYTSSLSTDRADAQLLCVVRDNGAYTIPASSLGNYYASNPASRSLNVLRWRTNFSTVDERSSLYIVSTLDTTLALID